MSFVTEEQVAAERFLAKHRGVACRHTAIHFGLIDQHTYRFIGRPACHKYQPNRGGRVIHREDVVTLRGE